MTTEVTVSLPDAVYRNALRLAKLTQRDLADLLAETLALSLPEAVPGTEETTSIIELSDADVLALTTIELPPDQDRDLSALLERQQAGRLTPDERNQLAVLMQIYQAGLVRKAQAIHEAVRRGLHTPLTP
jgi:hypothetical protein